MSHISNDHMSHISKNGIKGYKMILYLTGILVLFGEMRETILIKSKYSYSKT